MWQGSGHSMLLVHAEKGVTAGRRDGCLCNTACCCMDFQGMLPPVACALSAEPRHSFLSPSVQLLGPFVQSWLAASTAAAVEFMLL
jgi:hypothetical protein